MLPDDVTSIRDRKFSRSDFYGDQISCVDAARFLPLSKRNGSVLSKGTILKLEHFDSEEMPSSHLRLFGAPNYRRTACMQIYGVAQPDIAGLNTTLRLLNSAVIWCNSREEPMVYIAGRPFVLREENAPFRNIEAFSGISGCRLEQMEERLKANVLEETKGNGGLILVHEEGPNKELIPSVLAAENVQTSKEIFHELQKKFDVKYCRIPIGHNGHSPFDSYVDDLFQLLVDIPIDVPVIFSCGMGIGRSII